MKFTHSWKVGTWTFFQTDDHGFGGPSLGKPLFTYSVDDEMDTAGEMYPSLDHAMAAAIAEKHTGPRGAGGTGVGTAADWFMRMIGAGQVQEAGPSGSRALMAALAEEDVKGLVSHRVERKLEDQGFLLAREAR